jgi:DNA-binding GntR family transcriptional regulator
MENKIDRAPLISSSTIIKAQEDNPFIKLSDAVFTILELAILSSELKPGSRLNANKIAEQLQVSSSPVREAIDILVEEGFVVESQNDGGKYKTYHVFDIDDDDIYALFLARKSIESFAASYCANENWNIDLKELKNTVMEFDSRLHEYLDGSSVYKAAECDQIFHTMIINATKNKYIINMYNSIEKHLRYLSVRTCEFMGEKRDDSLLRLSRQHMTIYNAIELGFSSLARDAMDKHIDFCANNCLTSRKNNL